MDSIKLKSDKHFHLFRLMIEWMKKKQQGKNIENYLLEKGYHKIAIYGMHYVGERVVTELQNSKIHLECIIDKNIEYADIPVPLVKPTDWIPEVDAIIVTATFFYDDIKSTLSERVGVPVISLEEIIYSL